MKNKQELIDEKKRIESILDTRGLTKELRVSSRIKHNLYLKLEVLTWILED